MLQDSQTLHIKWTKTNKWTTSLQSIFHQIQLCLHVNAAND